MKLSIKIISLFLLVSLYACGEQANSKLTESKPTDKQDLSTSIK